MDDRLARLETQVEALARSVEELAGRLAAVERAPRPAEEISEVLVGGRAAAPSTADAEAEAEAAPRPASDLIANLALVGRTLMVLAGAYLLRALTEGEVVPPAGGIALGVAYALALLAVSDLSAARGRSLSATFYAGAAVVIAYPLVWEAATRFAVLSPPAAAAALGALTLAGLAVAWRRNLLGVAWLVSLGAIIASWALLIRLGTVLPFVAVLLALGIALVWMSHYRPWPGLRWLAAVAADLAVLILGVKALFGKAVEAPGWVMAAQLALVALYAGSIVARSLRPGWRIGGFDLTQTAVVLLVGYGGAIRLVPVAGGGTELGVASLLLAGVLFAGSAALLGKRAEWRHTFLYFPILAFAFLLGGTSLLLAETGRALAWSALALVAAAMATRFKSVTLGFFSALYAVAGAAASGLLGAASRAFAAPPDQLPTRLDPVDLVVLAAIAIACWIPFPRESRFWRRAAGVPKLALLAVFAWSAGGALLVALGRAFAGSAEGAGADPAILAALRTAVLAGAAVLLGWSGRWPRVREAAWLVYPVLVAGAVKLLWEDFPLGRPVELFVALALYGAALIFAPRLVRRRRS